MSEKVIVDEIVPITKNKTITLLQFQNGKLDEVDQNSMQFFPVKNSDNNTINGIVLANGNVYHGTYDDDKFGGKLMHSYIAIRNKKTNKARFIPVQEVSMTNYIYYQNDQKQNGKIIQNTSKDSMLKQFGGKKASRYLERAERMKIDLDVVKDQLEKTVNDVDLDLLVDSTLTTESNIEQIRPPFNANATHLNEVYNISDVIPQTILDSLNDEVSTILATKIESIPIKSEYMLSHIKSIQNSPSENSPDNLTMIKVFIYMDGLLSLIKTRSKNLNKVELSKITVTVENDIRERFTAPGPGSANRIRTTYSSEKALCYYVVLALLTSGNYQMDLNTLVQDLTVPKAKIVKYAHYVHAKIVSKTDILALRLPSSINPIVQRKGRRH